MTQTSTTENLTKHIPEDIIRRKLFDSVMQQKWKEVAEIYEKYPFAHTLEITSSGETALHLAIADPKSENKVENVKKLVGHIKDKEPLKVKTERGNTPLHLAAATGQSGKVCELLIKSAGGVESKNALELVSARCNKGETPLFKAVHYRRLGSFFYLHSIIREHFGENFSNFERNDGQSILDILVRNDGQSILHDAIIRENFGLAFYIIQLYKDLVNHVDNQGESPLHALARKATAFESGSSLHGFDKLIYKCISIEKLKPLKFCAKQAEEIHHINEPRTRTGYVEKERTNIDIESAEGISEEKLKLQAFRENSDEEKLKLQASREKSDEEKKTMDNASNIPPEIKKHLKQSRHFPETSRIWYYFVIFGYGPKAFGNIYKEKLKHTWAKQVLDELLESATMYGKNTTARPQENIRVVLSFSSGTNAGGKDVSQSSREEPSSSSGAGKDESSEIEKKDTVLDIAAKYGIVDMVKRIIDKFPVAIYDENINGNNALLVTVEKGESSKQKDTALLIAAKYGIVEMVKGIIKKFPVAIYVDEDINGNNVLLLAVEKRHVELYKHLIHTYRPEKSVIYRKENKKGNTALHLAATYDNEHQKPWPIPGVALQMVWEVKWYEFVEQNMPSCKFLRTNKDNQTPWDIFSTTHKDLIKDGVEWLKSVATSCSVVAALIATIAFTSSTTVPGGTDSNSGKPMLRNNSTFNIFATASLIALWFSVTALIAFLAILTSRYHERDFGKNLPWKILMGLTSLLESIAAMLVTFCASRFLVFEEKIKYAVVPLYAVTFFPLCLFAVAQFSLYFDLVRAIFFSPFSYDICFPSFLKKLNKKVKKS